MIDEAQFKRHNGRLIAEGEKLAGRLEELESKAGKETGPEDSLDQVRDHQELREMFGTSSSMMRSASLSDYSWGKWPFTRTGPIFISFICPQEL